MEALNIFTGNLEAGPHPVVANGEAILGEVVTASGRTRHELERILGKRVFQARRSFR